MPIYEYGCPNGHVFEVLKKRVDPIEQECEVCGAPCRRRPSLFNQSKKAGIYVFDRRYGGRDILHDPSISERERQDAISTIAAGMQEHREAMPP